MGDTDRPLLAIVQAGGAGGRMDVLTRERAKPALPFAGTYQLVDFPLSNCAHSGITEVWLSVSFLGSTLEEEVSNGRPWDLDRSRGGFRLLMPQEGTGSTDEEGFAQGNADELFRIRDRIRATAPSYVVVMSADHVYRLDYREVVATHVERGADCTLVTTTVPIEQASDHAVVEVGDDGTVTGFAYKPDEPATDVVATEVIVYTPSVLVEVLEELHRELATDSPEGDSGLGDFGDHLVPRLVERHTVVAHPLEGYWRDLGKPEKYLEAHLDVLTDDLGVMGVRGWPVLTRQPPRPPGRVLAGARVEDSLVGAGAVVGGTVVRSVLGPGVVVEAGATVTESVLFRDCVVRSGAMVSRAVVDDDCEVSGTVGAPGEGSPTPEGLVLVGRGSTVAGTVEPGARLEPGSTA